MTNTLAQWFAVHLGDVISPLLVIFIVSMIPILELRGGLIVASLLHVDMWQAIPICIIGNIIPVPFILFLIKKVFEVMKRSKHLGNLVEKLERRAYSKSDSIRRYEFWGLVAFVGIPLPGTGAWTGSLIAALLGIDRKKAICAVLIGILIATVIMTIVSYGVLGRVW